MSFELAASLLNVKANVLSEFDIVDSFNDDNKLHGFICRQADHRYGSLLITKVNDRDVEPLIRYCTPKVHYPFGESEKFGIHYHFPKFSEFRAYEKLDGTNICIFSYFDHLGQPFVTYKTRLVPLVGDGKFGSFKSMLIEMLEKYPCMKNPRYVSSGKFSLSFEMYGYRNPILIKYDIPLDIRLIFGVRQLDAEIFTPDNFVDLETVSLKPFVTADNTADLIKAYEKLQWETEQKNKKNDEDGMISGSEGFVFYTLGSEDAKWQLWKCKAPSIQDIHWAACASVPETSVFVTVKNALENISSEELSFEFVRALLLEEYTEAQIQRAQERIEKVIEQVKRQINFDGQVKEKYDLCEDRANKRSIMRHMSRFFSREIMSKVYGSLKQQNLIVEP